MKELIIIMGVMILGVCILFILISIIITIMTIINEEIEDRLINYFNRRRYK